MSLATKYRPKTWEDVTEQSVVTTMFSKMCHAAQMPNRNFLLIGPAGCGKTSIARIAANVLNSGEGEPIEVDAASHSGVDAMREIVQQARAFPIGCTWKVFIVDECFSGDVRVLTDRGFKRFDQLDKSEKIAQYLDDGTIEFVEPVRHIHRRHSGDMYKVYPKFGNRHVLMTPGHVQPVYNYYSNTTVSKTIESIEFGKGDRFILSGNGCGDDTELSPLDRLAIALAADGHKCKESTPAASRWQVRLSKPDKIARLKDLLASADVKWSIHSSEADVFEIGCTAPGHLSKHLSDMFSLDFSKNRAAQFIDEILKWDGSTRSGHPGYFSTTYAPDADFVSAVATLAGYSVQQKTHTYTDPNYATEYQVCMIPCTFNPRFKPRKELVHDCDCDVYCVDVPSHKIVVQADGFTFITGNCHSISSAGWQVMLKTIEEGPAKSIFMFCTTNPEKIPATILSRVQTFQLSKISLDGVFNRIKHVIEQENAEGAQISYTEDALRYIAKLSNGGMRDALTLLDKALVYNKNITSENILVALNLPSYDDYFQMLAACASKNNAEIAKIVNDVYNSGINYVKWFDGFLSFVMNVVKYILMKDVNATMIPIHYASKMQSYGDAHLAVCLKLANRLVTLNHELKSTQYLQEVTLAYLCTVPKK